MKAVLCKAFGPPESLVVEDVPSPAPGPGEAVVAVKAAGVNFPDVLITHGRFASMVHLRSSLRSTGSPYVFFP